MFERWCPWLRRPYPLSVDRFLHTPLSQIVTSLAWGFKQ